MLSQSYPSPHMYCYILIYKGIRENVSDDVVSELSLCTHTRMYCYILIYKGIREKVSDDVVSKLSLFDDII